MTSRQFRTVSALAAGALLLMAACIPPAEPEPDVPGSVALNELMYHPSGDVDDEEFLELHNPGTMPVDLGGWCLTDGVEGCFAIGTTLEPGGFVVAARNPAMFQVRYGSAADAPYSGKLSNGGERLVLRDDTGDVRFDCTYSDDAPWPTAPDGAGSSLERLPGDADCNDPAAWTSSTHPNGSTPGGANSSVDPSLPSILSVEVPDPTPGEDVPILVRTDRASSVSVDARIDFGEAQAVTLHDDGAHGDGAANDGTWGGSLPATPAAGLLRYRTTATSSAGIAVTDPPASDGMQFRGVVAPDGTASDLPRVNWYMDPDDYQLMTTEHLTDDQTFPAVIATDGRVYDNATVSVKGTSTVYHPKKKFAFDLPEGYLLDVPWLAHGIDEFDLQADFNFNPIDERPAWRTFDHYGVPTVQNQFVRVHTNGDTGANQFFGTYLLREDYDGKWRTREGFDDGTFFKHGQENKTDPDAGAALAEDFIAQVRTRSGDDLKSYLLDHLDVPAYINFMALATVTQYDHWGWYFNVDQFVDATTGRWQYVPLDLDATYDGALAQEPTFDRLIDPSYDPHLHIDEPFESRYVEQAVFQFPDFREMYLRRFVSIHAEISSGQLARAWYDEEYFSGAGSFHEDHVRWLPGLTEMLQDQYEWLFPGGVPPTDFTGPSYFEELSSLPQDFSAPSVAAWWDPAIARELFHLNQQYFNDAVTGFQLDGLLPADQGPAEGIEISGIGYGPEGHSTAEFIAIRNSSSSAVDLSGWEITGAIDLDLPPGAVLPAGGCAVVVRDDPAYRAYAGGGHLVLGEFAGEIVDEGGSLALSRRDGSTAGQFSYSPSGSGVVGTPCSAP